MNLMAVYTLYTVLLIAASAIGILKKKHDDVSYESSDLNVPYISYEDVFFTIGEDGQLLRKPVLVGKHIPKLDMAGELNRKFFIESIAHHDKTNLACSPMAALLPLGKLTLAVTSEQSKTFRELAYTIGIKHTKYHGNVSVMFHQLKRQMRQLRGVQLEIGTRIYLSDKRKVSQAFKKAATLVFNESVVLTHFSDGDKLVDVINKWVSEKTHGKVKDVVHKHEIKSDTEMLIIDVVYFKGKWDHKFMEVYQGQFRTPTSVHIVPMMKKMDNISYYRCDSLYSEMAEIFYFRRAVSMIVVLPLEATGLPVLLEQLRLRPRLLTTCMEKMTPRQMHVTLPKFRIETELDMKELYDHVGLHQIFHPDSGLDNMLEKPKKGQKPDHVWVSKALHKAVIEVDEQGDRTEKPGSIFWTQSNEDYYRHQQFQVDHPFVFYIVAKQQQIIAGVLRHF